MIDILWVGFAFANRVEKCSGMDIIPEKLRDANTMLNGWDLIIPTMAGTAEEIIPRWYKRRLSSRCSRVDPPYGV